MRNRLKHKALICTAILLVSIFFTCVVMNVQANDPVTVTMTIYPMETTNSNADSQTVKQDFTVTDFVDNGNNSYSGTIKWANANISYVKDSASGDTRYFVQYKNKSDEFVPITSEILLSDLNVTNEAGKYTANVYAVYGKTIKINFNNNASYLGKGNSVIVAKYYPQTVSTESSQIVTFPTNPSELSSDFMIDGYSFKGWGARESGETEMVSSTTINYGSNENYYAYWQDMRPQGTIESAGNYYLEQGTSYELGDGTWTVNGGSTKYPGSKVFYVRESGTYMLSK